MYSLSYEILLILLSTYSYFYKSSTFDSIRLLLIYSLSLLSLSYYLLGEFELSFYYLLFPVNLLKTPLTLDVKKFDYYYTGYYNYY